MLPDTSSSSMTLLSAGAASLMVLALALATGVSSSMVIDSVPFVASPLESLTV
jgi:hypothetical protein